MTGEAASVQPNPFLMAALQVALIQASNQVHYPESYGETLLDCLNAQTIAVQPLVELKAVTDEALQIASARFKTLLDTIANLPTLDFGTAQLIAQVADTYRHNYQPLDSHGWQGDVSSHFQMSSSSGTKGRILSTIVRCMRAHCGIEVGTAYGMSALFTLEMMQALHPSDYFLATLEGSKSPYELSSKLLRGRYGDRVAPYLGWTPKKLPQMVTELKATGRQFDFVFHDAGHSRKDYINDVTTLLPLLKPGAVVLVDDIRWNDPRFCDGDPQTYEGWLELTQHARVIGAAEINWDLGILLIGT
jgi:predicted O-methyltransferase YrrM